MKPIGIGLPQWGPACKQMNRPVEKEVVPRRDRFEVSSVA